MFGILLIIMSQGDQKFCDNIDDSVYGVNEAACLLKGGRWRNYDMNFDNIIEGFVALFVISTMEGWPDYLVQFVDGNNPEEGPKF